MKQTKTQALLALAAAVVLLVPSASQAQERPTSTPPAFVATSTATSTTVATSTVEVPTSTPFTIATSTGSEPPLWYVQALQENVRTAGTSTIASPSARSDLSSQLDELTRLLEKANRLKEAGSGASIGFWYSFRANFFENLAVSRLDRFIGNVVIYQERGVIDSQVAQAMTAWANTTIDRIRD